MILPEWGSMNLISQSLLSPEEANVSISLIRVGPATVCILRNFLLKRMFNTVMRIARVIVVRKKSMLVSW